ncbi:MAG: NAD(P)H-dependent oxidoreductase [Bacteroidales bacterium]|nr:NAD(P)H-dependent oxidoreductase [Bacteroidales bacterium]
MNILIILGHPDTNSFNHAIAEICSEQLKQNGHQVVFHDLYKENFDPIIETAEIPKHSEIDDVIQQHCNDLVKSDGIVIIHPNWWGQPPAIMKGWIDRVIRPGVAYEFAEGDNGEGTPIGLLKAQVGLVFNTSNTSEYRENNIFKDPLETIWKNCIFDFCGVKKFERKMFRIIVTSDIKQRQAWLNEAKELIDKYFPKTKL